MAHNRALQDMLGDMLGEVLGTALDWGEGAGGVGSVNDAGGAASLTRSMSL